MKTCYSLFSGCGGSDVGMELAGYWLVGGIEWLCLSADVRCLAAWQGFPADYDWCDNRGEAGRAIGNAVPPPLAKAIALSFG